MDDIVTEKNILIIANSAMNSTDSNGRNLSRLLDGIPCENKFEFFVYGTPDPYECNGYYSVSDSMAIISFFKRKKINGKVEIPMAINSKLDIRRKCRKKTPLKMLIREFIWKYGCWNNKYLYNWIESFKPACIIVVAADNCFILNLARKISKKRNIPIVLYSTEEYPFKNYNFVTHRFSLFYLIWKRKLEKAYNKIQKYVGCGVFNTQSLAKLYGDKYNYVCHPIYQKSNILYIENYILGDKITVSYLGNLGLNRHKALIELANLLGELFPNIKLDVYGKPNEEIRKELELCENINLKGFISYEEVVKIIHRSTLLVHAEYDDDFNERDLKYAFSTKIADSVCSGTPFLLYAPDNLSETMFLKDNKCAFVASTKEELKSQISVALSDENIRKEIVENAKIIRNEYFLSDNKMIDIIMRTINESNTNK